jgi:hypothetical protein
MTTADGEAEVEDRDDESNTILPIFGPMNGTVR